MESDSILPSLFGMSKINNNMKLSVLKISSFFLTFVFYGDPHHKWGWIFLNYLIFLIKDHVVFFFFFFSVVTRDCSGNCIDY